MDAKGKLLGISLLLFVGCLSTAPTIPQFDDPFPIQGTATPSPALDFLSTPSPALDFSLPQDIFEPESTGRLTPRRSVGEESLEDESSEKKSLEEEIDEFLFEVEETPILSEAEQVELLSQNQWIKNHARINMEDSGRKLNANSLSPEERKRRDNINRLNMDKNQLARLQNQQQYEIVDGTASDWRWMHRGVDKLYATPPSQRVRPDTFLREQKYRDKKYTILRANAAILMGRDGNTSPALQKFLLQLAQDEKTDFKIRCAAIEVLGRMEAVSAEELIPLLDDVQTTEIWEELLVAIAEKIAPWEHPCFLEPFYASQSEIRLANAKIWRRKSQQKQPQGTLPDKFIEIARRETNPAIRVELIKTLGAWQVPELFSLLENDLRHRTAEVRNAAILAAADARCEEAIPMIKDQLRDSLGTNRAAAVAALRKLGALDDVFKLSGDPDWRVRVEVAKAFSERCTPNAATLAKSYLSDFKREVLLATIEAVGSWSIEESGPLFLDAAKSPFQDVRCLAVEMLAQRGIAYSGFNPEDRPQNQTEHYQELVEIFREATGIDPLADLNSKERNHSSIQQVSATVPENPLLSEVRRCLDDWSDREQRQLIQRRLTAHGQRLMPMIDQLLTVENRNIPESLDYVFAEVDPAFREIEKLKSDDPQLVRRAAMELAQLGAVNSPSKLAAKRIVDLAAKQEDPLVLTQLLSALEGADSELVCQLARPLLQSDSVRVRRVACEMLLQHGTSEDVPLLHEVLRDSNPAVARGALLALGTLLHEEDSVDSAVLETLNMMLMQGDFRMQTDVAATLHRLGQSEGTNAIRRLAANNDHQVRAYIARTIPGLSDPALEPILIRFLDDSNGTVRNEALKGLPVLVGEDFGGGGSTQQQIDRWKAWSRK